MDHIFLTSSEQRNIVQLCTTFLHTYLRMRGGEKENIKWMVRVHSQVEKDRRHDKKGKLQV